MKQEAFASLAVETTRREEICAIFDQRYDPETWNDWRWQMRHRLTRLDQFEKLLRLTDAERRGLSSREREVLGRGHPPFRRADRSRRIPTVRSGSRSCPRRASWW